MTGLSGFSRLVLWGTGKEARIEERIHNILDCDLRSVRMTRIQ
jgi:hypothetical protein